jgi:hypothetical protein
VRHDETARRLEDAGIVNRVFAGIAMLSLLAGPMSAQKRGDQATLVFTVSGAYIDGQGLWSVPAQPIQDGAFSDTYDLNRSVKSTFGASLSGTYYPHSKLGLTAEAFLVGLGYDDGCRLATPSQSASNAEICQNIDRQEKSAAAVAVSTGAIFRIASRETISPFARVSAGILFTNQSSVLTEGEDAQKVLLIVYNDEKRTRIRPAFALGVGTTFAINRGYYLRWEVRDNYLGLVKITGATTGANLIPPHETVYKHLLSVQIGLDVILERDRGRRY